jgi:uncharacterized protein with HEPN domain
MDRKIYRRLQDIVEYLGYAITFGEGANVEMLSVDVMRALSIERALEIAGEAAKQIPEDFRQLHPAIEWRTMAGLRDVLAHNYRGIRKEVILTILSETAPLAISQITEILKEGKP